MGNILLDKDFNPVKSIDEESSRFRPSLLPEPDQLQAVLEGGRDPLLPGPRTAADEQGLAEPQDRLLGSGHRLLHHLGGQAPVHRAWRGHRRPGTDAQDCGQTPIVQENRQPQVCSARFKASCLGKFAIIQDPEERSSSLDALDFLRERETVKRQSSAKDLKTGKRNIECISTPSMSDLFEFEPKFLAGSSTLDPWENQPKDSIKTPEGEKRCMGSLASTQLTLGMNGNSLGRSTLIASDYHSRSGIMKDSFTNDGKKSRISDFGGKQLTKGYLNKPVISSVLKKVDPSFTLSLSSAISGKSGIPARESGGSLSSQLESLKSHRVIRPEVSLL
jgi:hypothetical protein